MLDGFVPWPEDVARRYRERGYWRGVALGDALRASFAANADRIAVVDGGRRVTYADLGRLVDRLALHFASLGIARGAPVVFQLPNVLEFVIAYTIRGYYRAAEHNRAAFTEDGFYRTGDMVRLHPSGNLIVEGRRKDLINRGGEKISAEEVENLLLSHPAVLNAAVVAMPDPVLGERACAYVIPRPGARPTLAELTRFLSEDKRIARFKLPERLELRDRLPTTAVGKISKKDLREEIAQILEEERGRS